MLVLAYEYFLRLNGQYIQEILDTFSTTAKEVCEGQQYDMDFETEGGVSITDYLEMIRLKTAVLIGASFKIGAILAGTDNEDIDRIYQFGVNAGLAFQLMDDLLDAYGDETSFGKRQYGDIHTNKKTFLYLKALELSDNDEINRLKWYYSDNDYDPQVKVSEVIGIFDKLDVKGHTEKMIKTYHDKSIENFALISAPERNKEVILEYAEKLMARKY
jgi:geranylgeranyl diphosphate synthase type II